jgi:preprotein translocase subunit SecA
MRREELVTQALTALHLFERDDHYLVRDGKIQVIDEHTGRVMADRSWGQGLHQLIEAKEACEITPRKESLARISYQRFFRRYLHLSGMTGTAAEVAGELGSVYGLAVVRVPSHRPSRRSYGRDRIFTTAQEKWLCIADRVAELHAKGIPVLLGTRSVVASEIASGLLSERGLDHEILSAKQDEEEARIVASAGEPGCITIATNMAGRGTDIKLAPGVEAIGGLHVILSERHEAGRIDRQLIGRCARQGDPGKAEAILSLEDPLLLAYRGGASEWFARAFAVFGGFVGSAALRAWIGYAQYRTERAQSRVRKNLLKSDKQMGDILSFSGRPE